MLCGSLWRYCSGLPPNPISISVPTEEGAPLMLDMTTSMVAGGKVSLYHAIQKPVPSDWLIGADGKPVRTRTCFLKTRLPCFHWVARFGHKGYGLAVMIDAIAGGLSWAGCSAEEPTRGGSGFLALAIDIASFIDVADSSARSRVYASGSSHRQGFPGSIASTFPARSKRPAVRPERPAGSKSTTSPGSASWRRGPN